MTIKELPVQIDEHQYLRFAAFDGGYYIGTCDVKKDGNAGYFRQLFVRENYRRQGVASHLLRACKKMAEQWGCSTLECECRKGNMAALYFYQRWGFIIAGEDNEDWFMSLSLTPARIEGVPLYHAKE